MNRKTILSIGVAVLTIATVSACGHHHGKTWEKHVEYKFNKIDANSDGFITKEEKVEFMNTRFEEADSNKDGKLTLDEMKAHKRAKWKKHHSKKGESY